MPLAWSVPRRYRGRGSRFVALCPFLEGVILDPARCLRVYPFDVVLEIVSTDAVVASTSDLGRAELTAADQSIGLGHADRELFSDLRTSQEPARHRDEVSGKAWRVTDYPQGLAAFTVPLFRSESTWALSAL